MPGSTKTIKERELLTEDHVDNPGEGFSTVSFWDGRSDPTVQGAAGTAGSAQPPYYVVAGLPGQQGASFQLTSGLVSRARQFLSAYVSASSDPANYGKITVLQLPAETQTLGPQQVQAQFLGSPLVSQELNLLRQNQTTIEYGNLLTLPVGGGLLYVEPVYIERAGQSASYPVLARVLVSYNGRVGYDADLGKALEQVFGAGAGNAVNPAGQGNAPASPNTASPSPSSADQTAAAAQISSAISQLKSAQQSGDFTAQGQALSALDQAVQRYQAAQSAPPAATPSGTPSPAPPGQPGG